MSQIAIATQPQPCVASPLTPEQLAELTNMVLGPGADSRTLLKEIDDTPYADMKGLIEGTINPSEYIKQEKQRQEAMRREEEELKAACMEMMQALAGAQAKTRSLVVENQSMISFLLGSPAVQKTSEQVADLQGQSEMLRQLAEPLRQPLSEQLLEALPDAADLLQDLGLAEIALLAEEPVAQTHHEKTATTSHSQRRQARRAGRGARVPVPGD